MPGGRYTRSSEHAARRCGPLSTITVAACRAHSSRLACAGRGVSISGGVQSATANFVGRDVEKPTSHCRRRERQQQRHLPSERRLPPPRHGRCVRGPLVCIRVKKVKFSHTRYRALGPELIPVYRQSARRCREVNHDIDLAVGCHYFLPDLRLPP